MSLAPLLLWITLPALMALLALRFLPRRELTFPALHLGAAVALVAEDLYYHGAPLMPPIDALLSSVARVLMSPGAPIIAIFLGCGALHFALSLIRQPPGRAFAVLQFLTLFVSAYILKHQAPLLAQAPQTATDLHGILARQGRLATAAAGLTLLAVALFAGVTLRSLNRHFRPHLPARTAA